jgi:hypothetical protein
MELNLIQYKLLYAMNNKNGKEFICTAQAIRVFTTIQINQHKTPGSLGLILIIHQLISNSCLIT